MEKAICGVKNQSIPNIPSLTRASFHFGKQSADGFGKPLESDKMSFEVCLRFSIMRSPRFMVGTVRIPVEEFFTSIFSCSIFLYNLLMQRLWCSLGCTLPELWARILGCGPSPQSSTGGSDTPGVLAGPLQVPPKFSRSSATSLSSLHPMGPSLIVGRN